MSVSSTTFGGVRLTGDDAEKFKNQVTYGKPKQAAVESLSRGRPLVTQYLKQGFATLKKKKA